MYIHTYTYINRCIRLHFSHLFGVEAKLPAHVLVLGARRERLPQVPFSSVQFSSFTLNQ